MMPHTHMLRKKIKLITLDLDNTVWPNNKVIVEAEKAMWDFVFAKFPEIRRTPRTKIAFTRTSCAAHTAQCH